MPIEDYEKRNDSVLAWKKRNQLGRFDPNSDENKEKELQRQWQEVKDRDIEVGKRCRVGERRGFVRFVGVVEEIPGKGVWVGFECDEPTGTYFAPLLPLSCILCAWASPTERMGGSLSNWLSGAEAGHSIIRGAGSLSRMDRLMCGYD